MGLTTLPRKVFLVTKINALVATKVAGCKEVLHR